jgi:hypothetical protein
MGEITADDPGTVNQNLHRDAPFSVFLVRCIKLNEKVRAIPA